VTTLTPAWHRSITVRRSSKHPPFLRLSKSAMRPTNDENTPNGKRAIIGEIMHMKAALLRGGHSVAREADIKESHGNRCLQLRIGWK
jgi:hypothetical protein